MSPTRIKTIINYIDIDENTEGSQVMALRRNINNLSNGEYAYSSYTWDTIFLLSIDEARTVKNEFGVDVLAVPTPEAINRNEASIANLASDMTSPWWLRDADGQAIDPQGVRTITQDGWVGVEDAYRPDVGVRPAFYLNMNAARFTSGSGTYDDPYRVDTHSYGEPFTYQEPTCTERGVLRRICAVCGEAYDEPIPVAGHSFGEAKVHSQGIFSVRERVCERCGEVHTERRIGIIPTLIAAVVLLAAVALWIRKRKK